MLLSCKISNALINFLERRGSDLEPLFDSFNLPGEFLRDPTYWIEAKALEGFLQTLDLQFSHLSEESLLTEAGHASGELHSWGVLDSVLKMVPSPQDIFTQPDRFLAYFISPPPPIAGLNRLAEGVEFQVPLSRGQYPYFTEYLVAAMESLPTYVHQPYFKVRWEDHHLQVLWDSSQGTLLSKEEEPTRQLQPEMIHRMLKDLEDQQRNLEKAQKALRAKDREIEELRSLGVSSGTTPAESTPWVQDLEDSLRDIYKLQDYFSRAAQLVTLLVGQNRMDGQVREAMRRMDWDRLVTETPFLTQQVTLKLKSLKGASPRGLTPTERRAGPKARSTTPSSQNLTFPLDTLGEI